MQIGHGKQGVIFGEYECDRQESNNSETLGWVEPAGKNPQWVMWFDRKGDAVVYTQRGPNGEVEGEPIRLKAKGFARCKDKPHASITGNMEVGRIKINGEDHLTIKVDKNGGNLKWVWPDGDVYEIEFGRKNDGHNYDDHDPEQCVNLVGRTQTIILVNPHQSN